MKLQDFAKAIKKFKPTAIIGVSTMGGAFSQKVVAAMAEVNDRPIVLALSNPTEHAECTAEQATAEQLEQGLVYPLQSNILEIEIKVAARVAKPVVAGSTVRSHLARHRPARIQSGVQLPFPG